MIRVEHKLNDVDIVLTRRVFRDARRTNKKGVIKSEGEGGCLMVRMGESR